MVATYSPVRRSIIVTLCRFTKSEMPSIPPAAGPLHWSEIGPTADRMIWLEWMFGINQAIKPMTYTQVIIASLLPSGLVVFDMWCARRSIPITEIDTPIRGRFEA